MYFPKFTVTSNNNKINKVFVFFNKTSCYFEENTNTIKLYETLINNSTDDILIIISHRLTFMQKIDKIICLSDGSIKEIGTHDDLICQNGCYKKMYDLNSSKYK